MTIPAHESPLAALEFDLNGSKLATASERVIKNFKNLFYFTLCLNNYSDHLRVQLLGFFQYQVEKSYLNFVVELKGFDS